MHSSRQGFEDMLFEGNSENLWHVFHWSWVYMCILQAALSLTKIRDQEQCNKMLSINSEY